MIIPNLHSPVIGEVLDALLRQADAIAEPVEVWVVGKDRYGQVRSRSQVRMFTTPEPVPPAEARNLGAASARGDTLIFLDADCVPQPGWLKAMLEAAARWPNSGAISGAMLADGDTPVIHCGQIAGFHEHLELHPSGRRRVLASFSLLVSRPVWEATGGFNEKLRTGEDLDFSIRVALLGRPLYFEPGATVRHRHQRTSWRSLWQHDYRSGSHSILVRRSYASYYEMPRWMFSPWMWILLSPAIAVARTAQIYGECPGVRRHWRCLLWVVGSKLAWCWGAAAGLWKNKQAGDESEGTCHDQKLR